QSLTKTGAGTLNVRDITVNGLNISAGRINVEAQTDSQLLARSLAVSSTATLDLGDSQLVIDYSGASPLVAIQAWVTRGYNEGNWAGTGITSSILPPNMAIGYAELTDLPAGTAIPGVTDSTAVIVRAAIKGDL